MTYAEALEEIDRIRAQESADFERDLAARRGPDGMLPVENLSDEERIQRIVNTVIICYEPRKESRGDLTLLHGHPDGNLRWVEGVFLEGTPAHPIWQAALAESDPLTQKEMEEDDWWVEAYDPADLW